MLIGSIDIGGTKTIAAITASDGSIRRKLKFPTNTQDYFVHFLHCCDVLKQLAQQEGTTVQELHGIGINLPGMVDHLSGILFYAPFATWKNVPVRQIFQDLLQVKDVFIDNDVKTCALGEKYFGIGQRYGSYVWVTISTGIGAAIVIDGKVLRGVDNLAGELGHVKVEYEHPRRCSCGKYGCLEAHASGTAITACVRETAERDAQFKKHFCNTGLSLDAIGCAKLVEQGNLVAQGIYDSAATYLARGLSATIQLLNPKAVILGGGVSKSIHLMTPGIHRWLMEYVSEELVDTEIVTTGLGYEAALIGTAALVMEGKERG